MRNRSFVLVLMMAAGMALGVWAQEEPQPTAPPASQEEEMPVDDEAAPAAEPAAEAPLTEYQRYQIWLQEQEAAAAAQAQAQEAPPPTMTTEEAQARETAVLPAAAIVTPAFSPSYKSPNPPPATRKVNEHWSAYSAPPVPEGAKVHVIQRGDTLWRLSEMYYQDAYLWPQLWANNMYIMDPHWIYPGDPVFIETIHQITPEGIEAAVHEARRIAGELEGEIPLAPDTSGKPKMVVSLADQPKLAASYDEMYCSFYLDADKDVPDFKVLSLEEPRQSIVAAEQIIYVNQGANYGLEPGQDWGVYRKLPKVQNKFARKAGGGSVYPVYRLARARVLAVQPDSAVMRISYSCRDVQRGDFLAPWMEMAVPIHIPRVFERTTFVPDESKPQAHVVYTMDNRETVARGDLIAVGLGRKDGVEVGDNLTTYFEVKEKGTKFERYEVAGQLVVLYAGEDFSTCKFVGSYRESQVGDMVQLQ